MASVCYPSSHPYNTELMYWGHGGILIPKGISRFPRGFLAKNVLCCNCLEKRLKYITLNRYISYCFSWISVRYLILCFFLTLFHAGSDTTYSMRGWAYMPTLWILRKKGFCSIPLHTHRTTKKRSTHKKSGFLSQKTKKMVAVSKSSEWNMEDWFRQYFAFSTSWH